MVRFHHLTPLLGTALALSVTTTGITTFTTTGITTGTARADETPWRYVQTYHSRSGCQEAGETGRRARQWTEAKCVRTPSYRVDPYNLWVR
jgi:hypothetical protein